MRIYFLILTLFLFTSLYSQDSFEWKIIQTNIDCLEPAQDIYTINIVNDTTVNGNIYQKTSYKNYLFRELEGKVFCMANEREYLLYDFTLEPNESFEIGNGSITIICLKVEDTDRKKLTVEYSKQTQYGIEKETDIWIEGMGSCKHPFWIDFVFPNPGAWETKVLCFHRDNQLLYLNKLYSNCDGEQSTCTELQQNSKFNNPVKDKLTLTLPNAENEVKIFDLQGKLLLQQNVEFSAEINVSMLPTGMYVLVVNGESYKFVKE